MELCPAAPNPPASVAPGSVLPSNRTPLPGSEDGNLRTIAGVCPLPATTTLRKRHGHCRLDNRQGQQLPGASPSPPPDPATRRHRPVSIRRSRWTSKAEVLSSASMGLSDRQLPQTEKMSRDLSPGLGLPRQTRAEGAWKDKELLSSFKSPAGRGLQPPPPAWRDVRGSVLCLWSLGARGSPPGETRRDGGAGHGGAPMAVLVKVPVLSPMDQPWGPEPA